MKLRLEDVSQIDRLTHEPARLAIMTILSEAGESDFLYLQREGGFTQGNLSGHLSKLEETGYIAIEKKFKGKVPLTVCSLTGKGEAVFFRYRQSMLGILRRNGRPKE
ncbi:MAG TPA: transcriptional regulator [Bryobacteraceae bacterium]|nr:transcriptional regulator [Bryobacteraceae bacterium]